MDSVAVLRSYASNIDEYLEDLGVTKRPHRMALTVALTELLDQQ